MPTFLNSISTTQVAAGVWNGDPIADAKIASASAWNAKANDSAVVHNTGTETVAGTKTFSNRISSASYHLGTDAGIFPVVDGQSIVMSHWAMQLRGLSQTVPADFTPVSVGARDFAHVVVPLTYSAVKGLVVRGAASQSANIQEWQDSSGANLSSISSTGAITGSNLSGTNTGNVTLTGESYVSLAGQALAASAVNLSGTHATGTLAAARFPALTGNITTVAGSLATTIQPGVVTNAMLAGSIAAAKLVGTDIATVGTVTAGTWDASTIAVARGGTGRATLTLNRLLAGNGTTAVQEVTVGAGLSLSAGTLTATGGGGSVANSSQATGAGPTLDTTEATVGTVTITPSSTSAKILILARLDLLKDAGTTARTSTVRVRRGSTNSDTQVGADTIARSQAIASTAYGPVSIKYVDSPATTSAVTYTLRGLVDVASATTTPRYELVAVELAPKGDTGAAGAAGATGQGVPTGGATGQVLAKIDATNYNTQWTTPATGSGDLVSPLTSAEVSITGAVTLTSTAFGKVHICSGTAADYTVTLPAVSGNAGKFIGFRMASGLTRLVTIDGNLAETINGQATRAMWANESAILLCDGTTWAKVAGRTIPMSCTMRLFHATDYAHAQSIATDTAVKLILNGTDVDNTGRMADLTNSRSIVRRPGVYVVTITISFGGTNGLTTNITRILGYPWVNGTQRNQFEINGVTGSYPVFGGQQDLVLVVGDYVELYIAHFGGNTEYVYGNATQTACILKVSEQDPW